MEADRLQVTCAKPGARHPLPPTGGRRRSPPGPLPSAPTGTVTLWSVRDKRRLCSAAGCRHRGPRRPVPATPVCTVAVLPPGGEPGRGLRHETTGHSAPQALAGWGPGRPHGLLASLVRFVSGFILDEANSRAGGRPNRHGGGSRDRAWGAGPGPPAVRTAAVEAETEQGGWPGPPGSADGAFCLCPSSSPLGTCPCPDLPFHEDTCRIGREST